MIVLTLEIIMDNTFLNISSVVNLFYLCQLVFYYPKTKVANGTGAEHSADNPKLVGLNPGTGTSKEKMTKNILLLDNLIFCHFCNEIKS